MNETGDGGSATAEAAPARWRRIFGLLLVLAFLVAGAWFLYRWR